MSRAAALALTLGLALPGPLLAEAPLRTPTPLPRPAALATDTTAEAQAPSPKNPSLAAGAIGLRPESKPETVQDTASAGSPSLSPRPLPRSAGPFRLAPGSTAGVLAAAPSAPLPGPLPNAPAEAPKPIPAAMAMPKGAPAPVMPLAGSVCGIPSIRGKIIPPVRERNVGCGLENGVQVTEVAGVGLSMPITVDCNTASTLDRWVASAVKPAVGTEGGGLAKLQIAGSYTCRTRNHQSGAKISEHGRGHAVDVSGLTLKNGRTITVAGDWRDRSDGAILKRIHKAACGPFGTVLGPGSDGFHEDHIHVDTAKRRTSAYCR